MDSKPYLLPGQICMDMIDTLPDDKKYRVESWFKQSKAANNFQWRDLLDHWWKELQDTQAQQAAHETLQRMEQGEHKYFIDFLKDFEHKMAQSGGNITYTTTNQTMQLKFSINRRLWRALLSVKLPSPENYNSWVAEVKENSAELEGFDYYRPKNSAQTKTKLGNPKGGNIFAAPST